MTVIPIFFCFSPFQQEERKNYLQYIIIYSINQYLSSAERCLKDHGIHSPLLDAEVMLCAAINNRREFLYAHPEYEMTGQEIARYGAFVKRRSLREPIAYIINKKEFYCLDFFVDNRVLIPRPETEGIVEAALNIINGSGRRSLVIDVGTGSGCVIVSIAKHSDRSCQFLATDISSDALDVAKENAARHGVLNKIAFFHGDLIEPILNAPPRARRDFDAIVIAANLPYIAPSKYPTLEPEITNYEPREALLVPREDPCHFYRLLEEQLTVLKKIYPARIYRLYETNEGIKTEPIPLRRGGKGGVNKDAFLKPPLNLPLRKGEK